VAGSWRRVWPIWRGILRPRTLASFAKSQVFVPTEMPLVTRKSVFPYEYTDSYSKLRETELSARREFYSALTETHVSYVDYEHSTRVWNRFECQTLGDYSDLYLKIDVLLSADVFENFLDIWRIIVMTKCIGRKKCYRDFYNNIIN